MTYITLKESQTNGSLFEKTLSLKGKNIVVQKIGYMSKYYYNANYVWDERQPLITIWSSIDAGNVDT